MDGGENTSGQPSVSFSGKRKENRHERRIDK